MTTQPNEPSVDIARALELIEQAEALLAQSRLQLRSAAGSEGDLPYMDAATIGKVEKLGEVAARHLEFIETHGGSMTRADSLKIRREMYGEEVRSTANLFGRQGSNALFWRDRPYGSVVQDGDPIRMTDEGQRIAELWRATRSGASK